METGRTVILLNLESLYESLYDALNQVWCFFIGQDITICFAPATFSLGKILVKSYLTFTRNGF